MDIAAMDTLKASEVLHNSGIDKPHAEAIARVINDFGRDDLATRQDLRALRSDVEGMLWKQTAVICGMVFGVVGLFKVFS
ncbi:MAG: hypothetical protein AAFO75_05150 [Pseudomonadota bacterium]